MTPAPEDQLTFFRVAPTVNSNRAEGPDLIEPLDPQTKEPPSKTG